MSIPIKELSSTQIKVLCLLLLTGPERTTNLRVALGYCTDALPKGYLASNTFLKVDLLELHRLNMIKSQERFGSLDWGIFDCLSYADMHALIELEEFRFMVNELRQRYPIRGRKMGFYSYGSELLANPNRRELLLAVLNGDLKSYRNVLSLFDAEFMGSNLSSKLEASIWEQLLSKGQDCPEVLSDDMIPYALRYFSMRLFSNGVSADSWLKRVEKLPNSAFSGNLSAFSALASHLLWIGERSALESIKRFALDDGAVFLLAGVFAFLDGQWQEAEKKFQRALSCLRKELEDERAFWGNLTGTTHIFAAIKASVSENKLRQLTRRYCDALDLTDPSYGRFIAENLEWLDRFANRNLSINWQWGDWNTTDRHLILALSQFCFFVKKQDWSVKFLETSKSIARKAELSGYHLAAFYILSAMKRFDDLAPSDLEILARHTKEYRFVPLWQVLDKDDSWRMALDELEKCAAESKAEPAVSSQNAVICWHLTLQKEQDFYEVSRIEPKLKKLKTNGTLSAGRSIALEKIKSGEYDAYLSSDEQLLKAGIISYGDYGGWNRHCYYIKPDAVLGLLGNQNVFEDRNGTSYPVQIVSGELCLQVEKRNDSYSLSLPFPLELLKKGLLLRQESSDVYLIYRFTDEFKRIGLLLAKYGDSKEQLLIPAQGEKRFKEVVARIVGTIRVAGDLNMEGVEGIRQLQGDVDLHMRILQSASGFSMELLNKPRPELPQLFVPGQGAKQTFIDSAEEKLSLVRDLKKENSAVSALLAVCPSLSEWKISANRWDIDELEAALTVFGELHESAMITLEWTQGKSYKISRKIDFGDFEFNVGFSASEWLSIGAKVKLDENAVADLSMILNKLPDAVGDFIPLDEQTYLRLTAKMRRQLEELSGALHGKGDALTVAPGAFPLLLDIIPEKTQSGFAAFWQERAQAFRRALAITPSLPKGFQCELRPYQLDGFVWLSRLYEWGVGACLADDMGLGKTVQILALLLERASAGPSLVIAPASVCRNWQREALRFTPGLNVRILGNSDREEEIGTAGKYDVLVCSYGILLSEEAVLTAKEWNCVVLDEAQAIKNHQSKRAHAAKKLKAKFRLSATGTPIENRLDELWSLFDFINPKLLGTYTQFNRKFISSKNSTHALKKLAGPFILRRLKSQVLDELPPKTEISLEVTLSVQERALYENLRRNALRSISEDAESSQISILTELTRLRRACCHPSLLAPELNISGSKMELLADLLEELRSAGHRALIFSQFVDFLSIVSKYFETEKISYQYLDGSTPVEDRMRRVDAFQHGEGDFFLISLKAGGTGLNLTAANYVIILDPWWNPAVENQAADRVHRIGQTQPVTVYRLITADTVEERVIELHARKKEMAEEILDGAEKSRLSKDDLMALFQ